MTDIYPPQKRSWIMSRVRSKGSNIELTVETLLQKNKLSYAKYSSLPGKPDFILPDRKIAIFVHGCFWHKCGKCKRKLPQTQKDFWLEKLSRNALRDKKVKRDLKKIGWTVVEFWEHSIKKNGFESYFRSKLL